ncbi:MAG TPA: sugar ABC transporter ATP-binding protein [Planctomycetota bacterium]|nr:sugar ABC transporter ATP-binding protein [Planctomycetota bacterium]
MRGITKRFPGVLALDEVDLELRAGEVVALLGENGAGKSTLMKVLGGAYRPDGGEMRIDGADPGITDPGSAREAGVAVIWQEFALVPALSAAENIFLGRERARVGIVSKRDEERRARDLFARVGVPVDPSAPCRSLTVAEQQAVEIAKALSFDARVVVMDEPSATLTPQEVEKLFDVIRGLTAQGIGVIYISHRLDEIFSIADRIVVLRDGRNVGERAIGEVTREELIELMVGRKLDEEFPAREPKIGDVRLVARGLRRGRRVRGVDLSVRAGEILGLTGLVGAGRTETVRLIFGADRRDAGTLELDGEVVDIRTPRDAIRAGICLLAEDRKSQSLVLGRSVVENFSLPSLGRFSRALLVSDRAERKAFERWREALRIKTPGAQTAIRNLSGGNQQKVILARWLERDAKVVIFDEPTRGIDVGAKYEIYELMNDLAARGKAIVMISSELPEILGLSDRIAVMHEGRITGTIEDARKATQADILRLAVR